MEKKGGTAALIVRFVKGSTHLLVLSALFSIVGSALNALTPQVVRLTVDTVIGGQAPDIPIWLEQILRLESFHGMGALLLASGAVLVVSALSGLSTFFARITLANGSEAFVKRMRDKLFSHIQRLPFAWHAQNQTGDIIQRCSSDVEVIRNFLAGQLMEVFRTTFLIVLSLSILFSMNVKLALISLIFVPVVAAYSGIFFSLIAKRFRIADEAEGALSATVQENLTGVRVVRAFGREQFEIERFDEKNNKFSEFWIKLGHLLSYYWCIGDMITGLQIMVIVVAGSVAAVNGSITLGEFLAFISYNTTLVWPVRALGRVLSEMSKASVSASRISYILDAEEEADAPGAVESDMTGDIRFENVNFQYGDSLPVLKGIDFTIKAGSTFAILGGTGSGKSTLMHLLDRLYELPPECGRVTVGGTDISKIKRESVRSGVGMVLQEPFLFSRTIRENISAFRPESELDEVRRLAGIACVDDAVTEFPEGYETIVGERGVTLSGGQKQRVAIARMLMQKAPIMVFDDSLSAVDSETDAQIRAALKESLGKSTVILISHRITTLMQADCIAVLEDGMITEMGTHEQLIKRPGVYKQIYDIQMSSDDRALLMEEEGERCPQ